MTDLAPGPGGLLASFWRAHEPGSTADTRTVFASRPSFEVSPRAAPKRSGERIYHRADIASSPIGPRFCSPGMRSAWAGMHRSSKRITLGLGAGNRLGSKRSCTLIGGGADHDNDKGAAVPQRASQGGIVSLLMRGFSDDSANVLHGGTRSASSRLYFGWAVCTMKVISRASLRR